MKRSLSVNLGNLLLSLSESMDIANPSIAEHQRRVAYIVYQIANEARLSNEKKERLFTAALLHDIGALSVEEKMNLHNFETDDTQKHCIFGEKLLNTCQLLKHSAPLVRLHHTALNSFDKSVDKAVVLESQIINLADYVERLINRNIYILHQEKDIISNIKTLSDKTYHHYIVDCLLKLSEREEFWLDLTSPRLYSLLLHYGPYREFEIHTHEITAISELFTKLIDFRSHFTATHSAGVSASAEIIAKMFGFSEMDINLIKIAGNLHDIGKLAISNDILNKPGKLSKEEFDRIKSHTYYTYYIIDTIGGLQQIAEWAAYHHEKLDESGYPFHCPSDQLSTFSRIMAVADIFTALSEDRPYRKRMDRQMIVKILKELVQKKHLDSNIVNLLIDNFNLVDNYVREKQNKAEKLFKKEFNFPAAS